MKRICSFTLAALSLLMVTSCNQNNNSNSSSIVNINTSSHNEDKENEMNKLKIEVGNSEFIATLVDNSSTRALKELLKDKPLTIKMSDYGDFEKVGSLGTNLPRNDENITTSAGDLILYQGNQFSIYYRTNTWSFTRLGKIENVTEQDLLKVLGEGDVTVTLSLTK